MEKITVNGSTSYDVIIERGILDRVGQLVRDEFAGNKALIVTDSNVAALYLDAVDDSFRAAEYETFSFTLEPGDASKSMDSYNNVLSVLAENEFGGTDVIVALGGGMVGDLTGFAAATFKRGMHCVMIPTSLLAAVDASVGGKSAINLPSGKNQVGVIRNPSIVICDPNTMSTLSDEALHEGYAEVIKYGILTGERIIRSLRVATKTGDYSEVIRLSVAIKKSVVEKDEDDSKMRQFLNLGHLVGHAIEAFRGYEISHGQAVAQGLDIESHCAALGGFIDVSTDMEIAALLEEFGFDTSYQYSLADLQPYLLRDKRLKNGSINIIIPRKIGDCIMVEADSNKLLSYIEQGL
ncbi:MAG: 3-dehydroquinate synthase [Clostridiales bacterium]|nr:3-dehydroquinate synthase [Candidatus Crickella equi]